jgi:hypothetical protein
MWPRVSFDLDRFKCDETPGMYMNIYSKKRSSAGRSAMTDDAGTGRHRRCERCWGCCRNHNGAVNPEGWPKRAESDKIISKTFYRLFQWGWICDEKERLGQSDAGRTLQMNARIKKFVFSGILLFVGYFLASQHIVIKNREFKLLKKSELTYEYTFYNVTDRDPEDIIKIDMLREDGIGDILVDFGLLNEEDKYKLETYYSNLEE